MASKKSASANKIGENRKKQRVPNADRGRPNGAVNKITKSLREASVLATKLAGQELTGVAPGEELVEYLKIQAIKKPGVFLPFLGRVLPLQVTGEDGGAIETVVRIEIVGHRPEHSDDDTAR